MNMAAPAPTARQTPTGYKMKDGFSTRITFANAPAINFWEKEVTPPGLDGGGPIDITTMLNTKWRTKAFPTLKDLTEFTVNAAYDPDVFDPVDPTGSAHGLVNENQVITVRFPTGDTIAFWGACTKVAPGSHKEKEMPMCTLTIVPSNVDNSGAEQDPVYTPAAGT